MLVPALVRSNIIEDVVLNGENIVEAVGPVVYADDVDIITGIETADAYGRLAILLHMGFSPEEAIELNDPAIPFSPEQIQHLESSSNLTEFISTLDTIRPLLSQWVQQMQVHTNKTIINRLIKMGLNQDRVNSLLLYRSGRLKVTMAGMVANKRPKPSTGYKVIWSQDPVLAPADMLDKTVEIHGPTLIPVIRYGLGMTRGLYSTSASSGYCGTFYYYEPDSNTLLEANNVLVTPNKITASIHLLGLENTYLNMTSSLNTFGELSEEEEPYYRPMPDDVSGGYPGYDDWRTVLDNMATGRFVPTQWNKNLYAQEDRFDQVICRAAREKGFDVILLTLMTGGNRMVSEVLDVRDRAESFNSLIHMPDRALERLHHYLLTKKTTITKRP